MNFSKSDVYFVFTAHLSLDAKFWKAEVKYSTAAAAKSLSRVRLCETPQAAAHQAPLSLGFSRQEHWSGLPLPSLITGARSIHISTNDPV